MNTINWVAHVLWISIAWLWISCQTHKQTGHWSSIKSHSEMRDAYSRPWNAGCNFTDTIFGRLFCSRKSLRNNSNVTHFKVLLTTSIMVLTSCSYEYLNTLRNSSVLFSYGLQVRHWFSASLHYHSNPKPTVQIGEGGGDDAAFTLSSCPNCWSRLKYSKIAWQWLHD